MFSLRPSRNSTEAVCGKQRSIPARTRALYAARCAAFARQGGNRSRILTCLRFTPYLASALLLCSSLTASPIYSPNDLSGATLIDFDDLPGGNCNLCGTPVTTQYSGIGVTFNNPSNPGDDTADYNLTQYVPGASGNMLYVYQGGLMDDGNALPFQILFSVPVTAVGFDFASTANAYL